MNGIQTKIVVDTNFLFMSVYDKIGKASKIINAANEDKIFLYAPISVKEELIRVIEREMKFTKDEVNIIIEGLAVKWIEREIYQDALEKTKIKHKADKPIEALALILNCGILTADKHFDNVKQKININDLLVEL